MNGHLLVVLFAVPLLVLFRPLWRVTGAPGAWLNGALGWLEWKITLWRELGLAPWAIWLVVRSPLHWLGWTLVALVLLARWQRRSAELASAELMWGGPGLLPGPFFARVHQIYGPAGAPGEEPAQIVRPPAGYDMRDGQTGQLRLACLRVFLDSAWMTRIVMRSARRHGDAFLREHVDQSMRLWGLMVLWHARACLVTEGAERLEGLQGKRLFLFNHVSQTDFAFGFPSLDQLIRTDREVRLRFVVAKDHFVDNPVIHSWSGIGRLIMAIGMVPIDRKHSKRAVASLEEAAQRVADERIDLAIYPQGTRGLGLRHPDGSLLGVGFYSAAKKARAADPMAHIKKGTAFLALDAALALREREEPLHLVIVGIEGAGRLLPKGRLSMSAGEQLTYRVSEIITLAPGDFAGLSKRGVDGKLMPEISRRAVELTEQIERALARACRIDERLAQIWQDLMQRQMPDSPALRRLFDHALTLDPHRRVALFDALGALPETVEEGQLEPLFAMLEER